MWVKWMSKLSWPRQKTAACDAGCAWAPSAPGSSSSGLLGWCLFPSSRSQASQMWPVLRHAEGSAGGRTGSPRLPWGESGHLQVDHVPGERDFRVLSRVDDWDLGLPNFFVHKSCEKEVTRIKRKGTGWKLNVVKLSFPGPAVAALA